MDKIESVIKNSYKCRFSLIALSKTVNMELTSSQPIAEFIGEFGMLFAKTVDYENKKIAICPLQQNTTELKDNFTKFVNCYKEKEPKLNQLNEYFKALEDNENFYLIVNHDVSTSEHTNLCIHLSSIKEGKSYEVLKKQIDDLFEGFLFLYDVRVFDKNTKKTIGEKDKTERLCRFCGKKAPEVTFKSLAHALSEALGNKQIVLNEECDMCNNKFGTKVEIDLIKYLRFYCVFYGIKGKGKIPEIKAPENTVKADGKNFGVKNDGGLKLEYYQTDDNDKIGDEFPLNLSLRTGEEIIDQNIYKTLTKYALSVISSEHLPMFSETIKWLNGEKDAKKIPKIAMLVTPAFFDKHPKITLYIRKKHSDDLPYTVAELNFTAFTFSFIIPFCSADKKDFLNTADYDLFWETFTHYNKIIGWRYIDFSNTQRKKLTINLTMKSSEKKL